MSTIDPLPRSTAAAEGVSTAGLHGLVRALHDIPGLHSLMVLRHGRVIAEGWRHPYAADRPHALFSLSKSVTSMAVGLAVAERLLDLDDHVVDLLPDEAPAPAERSANLAAMRVRHLLTMTTGHASDPTEGEARSPELRWAQHLLGVPIELEPGSRFVYNSGASYLLSAIVQRVTGQRMLDYLAPRLLEPLGIRDARWEQSPQGIDAGGWGLSLTTEQVARFGQLVLQRGRWGDRQLVPAEWIDAATSRQVDNADTWNTGTPADGDWSQGYGFQFWRCRHGAFRGDGAFGQFCVVLPDEDAVVVTTGGLRDMAEVLDVVWEHLLPALALAGGAEPRGAVAQAEADTRRMLAGWSMPTAPGAPDSVDAAAVVGRRYAMAEPVAGIEAVRLRPLDDGRLAIELWSRGEEFAITAGHEAWVEGRSALFGASQPVAASFAWTMPRELLARAIWLETPFETSLALRFSADGSTVELSVAQNVDFGESGAEIGTGRAEG